MTKELSPGATDLPRAEQQAAIVASATDWAKAQTHRGDRKADQGEALHLETNALQGLLMFIGPKQAAELFLCEGYATGLSIELALRLMRLNAAVLVCFSDSNMVHVASMIKRRAFVFADNDASGAGQRAAEKTGIPWCMSETLGNDANDDHVKFGLMHVAQMLMKVRLQSGGGHG